jgi:futalosine hydrolase
MGLPAAAAGLLPFQSREAVTAADVGAALPVAGFLTACAASATTDEAGRRFRQFPGFLVEEMEAFAVARAARLSGVPFACLRGISNVAGDRRKSGWRLAEAMSALGCTLVDLAEELADD